MNNALSNSNVNENSNENGNENNNASPLNNNTNSSSTNNNENTNSSFSDIENHWGKSYIEKVVQQCHLEGFKDAQGNMLGEFKPNNPITRAELIKILVQCDFAELPIPTEKPFIDIPVIEWYAPAIAKAKLLQWISGYPNGYFYPNNNINRAEALKIILLSRFTLSDIITGNVSFIDIVKTAWYYKYISFAVEKGYVSGYVDANENPTEYFGPGNNLTRAEATKIIALVKEY